MSAKESALFVIADHPTPKIDIGVMAFSLRGRDYKAPQIVVQGIKEDECDVESTGESSAG